MEWIGPLLGPPQHRFYNIQGRAPQRVPKYRSEIMNRIWLPVGPLKHDPKGGPM